MKHLDCIVYTNATFKEKVLSVNGEIVLAGDAYHDKIDHMIEGFFYGIDYAIANGAQYSYSKSEKEIDTDWRRWAQMMRCAELTESGWKSNETD